MISSLSESTQKAQWPLSQLGGKPCLAVFPAHNLDRSAQLGSPLLESPLHTFRPVASHHLMGAQVVGALSQNRPYGWSRSWRPLSFPRGTGPHKWCLSCVKGRRRGILLLLRVRIFAWCSHSKEGRLGETDQARKVA